MTNLRQLSRESVRELRTDQAFSFEKTLVPHQRASAKIATAQAVPTLTSLPPRSPVKASRAASVRTR
jgi:hypothetical protein